eukprot:GEZU01008473.1.p1 GENE.GEZU01008473.1~~GEZU01008473.1.p1  ORF type:complete len:142 (-),score=21.64 GEZU01008473.1:146-571(-)
MDATVTTIVKVAAEAGEKFVKEFYYNNLDSNRSAVTSLYKDPSIVIWNGSQIAGTASIDAFLTQLAPTKHIIDTIDCQPIIQPSVQLDADKARSTYMLINVTGSVLYGVGENRQKSKRLFAQTFILVPEQEVTNRDAQTLR